MKQIINVKQVSLVLFIIFSALGLFSFYIIVSKVEVPGLELTTSDWKLLFAISAGMLIGLLVSQVLIPAIRSNSGESNGRDIEKEVRRQKKQTVTAYKKLDKAATKKKNALESFTEKYTKVRSALESGVAMAKEATAKIDSLPYSEAIKQSKLYKVIEKVESAAPAQLKKLGELENKIKATTAELTPLISEKEKLEPEVTLFTKKSTQVNAVQQKPDLVLFTQSDAAGVAWNRYKKILIPLGFIVPVLFITLMVLDNAGQLEGLPTNIFIGIVTGLDIVFFISFLGFLISTIRTWRKMKLGNQARVAEKKDSAAVIGFRRSWSIFNWLIIIFGALVPILFGVVILLLILKENEMLGITGTVLLVTAGVFVLLWIVAFIVGIVFWWKATKHVVKKIKLIIEKKGVNTSQFITSLNNDLSQNNENIGFLNKIFVINANLKEASFLSSAGAIGDVVIYLEKALLSRIDELYSVYGDVLPIHLGIRAPTYGSKTGVLSDNTNLFSLYMAFVSYHFLKEKFGDINSIPLYVFFRVNLMDDAGNSLEPEPKYLLNSGITQEYDRILGKTGLYKIVGKGSKGDPIKGSKGNAIYSYENPSGKLAGAFKFLIDMKEVDSAVKAYEGGVMNPFKAHIENIENTYDHNRLFEQIGIFMGMNIVLFLCSSSDFAQDFSLLHMIDDNSHRISDYKNNEIAIEVKGSKANVVGEEDISALTDLLNKDGDRQLKESMGNKIRLGFATQFTICKDACYSCVSVIVYKYKKLN